MELDQGVGDLPLHPATSRTAEVPPTLQVQGQNHVVRQFAWIFLPYRYIPLVFPVTICPLASQKAYIRKWELQCGQVRSHPWLASRRPMLTCLLRDLAPPYLFLTLSFASR